MFRVLPALAFSAAIAMGCALNPPGPTVVTKTVTQTVTVKEPGRTCTVTMRPMTSADFCETKKQCGDIDTCAEAYYRLTVCGHRWLDGGTAVRKDGEPNRKGEPDGIPCENRLCGNGGARMMVGKIRAEEAAGKRPFSLPMMPTPIRDCDPS